MERTSIIEITTDNIVKNRYFTLGFKDFIAEQNFDRNSDKWLEDQQLCYERGRQFAAATRNIQLEFIRSDGTITHYARCIFENLLDNNVIL